MQKNREGPGERAVYIMYYWQGKHSRAVLIHSFHIYLLIHSINKINEIKFILNRMKKE